MLLLFFSNKKSFVTNNMPSVGIAALHVAGLFVQSRDPLCSYEVMHGGQLATIFSARNYCASHENVSGEFACLLSV